MNPLSYQTDLRRLTQLFGRPLQMKYYNKRAAVKPPRQALMNEEGEIMEAPQEEEFDGPMEDVEVGFEEALDDQPGAVANLKDMFKVQQEKRFQEQMKLNPLAIQRQVDVKRLKN